MTFPYRKILCCIDFSAESLKVLETVGKMARHFDAVVILVHTVPLALQFEATTVLAIEECRRSEENALAKLKAIVKHRLGDVHCEIIVFSGDSASGALKAVERFCPDLVMNSESR